MPSLTCFNRYFTLNWRLLWVALIALVFLCKLGFWQLARAKEKTHLLEKYAQFAHQSPGSWRAKMHLPTQYQRVSLRGNYLTTVFFLDNQHYQHQFGYHIITPFAISEDEIVLVDRGWIAGDTSRQKLPTVDMPSKKINLMGSVYYPPTNHWLLGQSYEKKGEKGYLIEQLDPHIISHILHKSVYPFIIRLDKTEAYGYRRDWLIVAMPPERHYAYAVQWFLLALVVLVFFIVLSVKRIDEIK